MSSWQSGRFDRSRINSLAHPFTPAHAADSLHSISIEDLWNQGKRLLLLDVDNTMVKWHSEEFSDEVLTWFREAKSRGFDLCIISNTNRVERLYRIAELIGADTVRGRPKPSRAMYRLALIKFHRKAEEAIMIGDQLITDVFGANRSGIEAIWVRKMEGQEFSGTKINRVLERLFTGPIYQGLIAPIDEKPASPEVERAKPIAQKTLTHQIVRFAVVGGASFVVDFGFTYVFMKLVPLGNGLLSDKLGSFLISHFPPLFHYARGPSEAAAPLLGALASLAAMTNSFLMNRAWTFEVRGKAERGKQMRRFYGVSILGQLINLGVFTSVYNAIGNHQLLIPKILGASIAAVWNFMGSRFYAFRSSS